MNRPVIGPILFSGQENSCDVRSVGGITATMKALSLSLTTLVFGLGIGCERPSSDVPENVFGHCIYENRFSGLEECREFRGDGWDADAAQGSCDEYNVDLVLGACPYERTQGACVTSSDPLLAIQLVIPGDDAATCANNERGCEVFGGGTWVEGSVCGGADENAADDVFDADNYYVPETLQCVDPLAGEPDGNGEGGSVCTWNQISGCTEEGRRYEDYASCDDVRTQRPYSAVPPNTSEPAVDPRLENAVYAAEVEWVKAQVEACACVCCHKSSVTPDGAAVFDTEFAGNFPNSFSEYGLAFAARAFDSSYLGAFAPSENNGFGRDIAGLPSTDQERMKAFFEAELEHRGSSVAEWADLPPQPEIFFRQATFEPEACGEGQGVDADGTVRWTGGRARYVYVLDDGSENPGNPPNRDKPDGTLWRIDTVPPATPVRTGSLRYGVVPEGHKQVLPEAGSPEALVSGRSYLLFALADIGIPMTRCRFTME
jgi:hypothetical protein